MQGNGGKHPSSIKRWRILYIETGGIRGVYNTTMVCYDGEVTCKTKSSSFSGRTEKPEKFFVWAMQTKDAVPPKGFDFMYHTLSFYDMDDETYDKTAVPFSTRKIEDYLPPGLLEIVPDREPGKWSVLVTKSLGFTGGIDTQITVESDGRVEKKDRAADEFSYRGTIKDKNILTKIYQWAINEKESGPPLASDWPTTTLKLNDNDVDDNLYLRYKLIDSQGRLDELVAVGLNILPQGKKESSNEYKGKYSDEVVDFFTDHFIPNTRDWDFVHVDELITLLGRYRNQLTTKTVEREEQPSLGEVAPFEPALIESGLANGWLRENPLIRKTELPPPHKNLEQDSLKSKRKSLISQAMHYHLGTRKNKPQKSYRNVKDEMNGDNVTTTSFVDPVEEFDEELIYREREKMIKEILDSPSVVHYTTSSEISSSLVMEKKRTAINFSSSSKRPDGLHPTFLRADNMIGKQALVRFY